MFLLRLHHISLVRQIDCKEKAVAFFVRMVLFIVNGICANRQPTSLELTDLQDRWRCRKYNCRRDVGLRKKTWFQGNKLPFDTIFFTYAWANKFAPTKFCSEELKNERYLQNELEELFE